MHIVLPNKIMIRAVDPDVVVIGISVALGIHPEDELWIAFRVGKNLQCLAAHQMAAGLGPVKARTLLVNKVTTRSLNVCHLVERQYQHVHR